MIELQLKSQRKAQSRVEKLREADELRRITFMTVGRISICSR